MREERNPTPMPAGEQSTLERFVRHETEHRPNAVSGRASKAGGKKQAWPVPDAESSGQRMQQPDAAENSLPSARRAARAVREGALHGALYYAGAEQPPQLRDGRYQESEDTVLAKMNSKENFPQG